MTPFDQMVGEVARLSRICRMQEEVISQLAEIARSLTEELSQHRAVEHEEMIFKELEEQGWINLQP